MHKKNKGHINYIYIDVCNLQKNLEKVGISKTNLWHGPPKNNGPKSQ